MPNDYMEKINIMSFEEAAKYTIERFNLKEKKENLIKEWNEMAIYEYSNNIRLKPNVKEYLEKLKEKSEDNKDKYKLVVTLLLIKYYTIKYFF